MVRVFFPVINVVSAVVLLIIISIYDMIAVWKSKHMIAMAKFQTRSKVFAGLMLPYHKPEKGRAKIVSYSSTPGGKQQRVKSAILGGGDIAFPLLFSGVIMKTTASFLIPAIITVCAALALFGLLVKGESNKFYPAMPFISIGCFAGYLIANLLVFIA